MPKKMNSTKYGMFPNRKKHTTKTLKKDVKELRQAGYPVKISLHTLDTNKKSKSKKTSKLAKRGLITKPRK